MEVIRIVTDSTCNLPKATLDAYGIRVLPSFILFGNERYREGVDLNYEDFCSKLKSIPQSPSTSPCTSGEFATVYTELAKETDTIFSIHISANLSNYHRNAQIAADVMKNQTREKPLDIVVVNSRMLDMGLGMLVLEAAAAAKEGKSKEEVQGKITQVADKMKGFFYVDTLEFLMRSARISRLKGLLAGILNKKPILTIENGDLVRKDVATGKEKAAERMLQLIEKAVPPGSCIKVGVSDAQAKEDGDRFLNQIKSRYQCVEVQRGNLRESVVVHAGLGAFGVFFYAT